MKRCYRKAVGMFLIGPAMIGSFTLAQDFHSSAPGRATVSVYDTGQGLVEELRGLMLAQGENQVRLTQLPERLDPASVSIKPLADSGKLEILEQRFEYDLADPSVMLRRFQGKKVKVTTANGVREGILAGTTFGADTQGAPGSLALLDAQDNIIMYLEPEAIQNVEFPDAAVQAFLTPTLLWKVKAAQEGPVSIRLSYATKGLNWKAAYECTLNKGGSTGYLVGRIELENFSGVAFRDARVRLISSEIGSKQPLFESEATAVGAGARRPTLQYGYGRQEASFDRQLAGYAALDTYTVPGTVTLSNGERKYLQLCTASSVPLQRFFVYDGVKFDRFQRNRRNDWSYGTESQPFVEEHIRFTNTRRVGLGVGLPSGTFRLYQEMDAGPVDLLGLDQIDAPPIDGEAFVRIGPTRGLHGERQRTGYAEIRPLHEYEESFEIRLENDRENDAKVRVVEHLYRWSEYEIVKSDTEYKSTGPQTIEFLPVLKAGGKRSIHYTVRYTW